MNIENYISRATIEQLEEVIRLAKQREYMIRADLPEDWPFSLISREQARTATTETLVYKWLSNAGVLVTVTCFSSLTSTQRSVTIMVGSQSRLVFNLGLWESKYTGDLTPRDFFQAVFGYLPLMASERARLLKWLGIYSENEVKPLLAAIMAEAKYFN